MGKRDNFTADRVASFKCDPGKQQCIYWDGKTPGFGLRVTVKGVKSYIFETRLHGNTLRTTIGSPDTWPLETQWRKDPETGERREHRRGAREEAQRLKALTDQGIDPRQQAIEQQAKAEHGRSEAKRKQVTFAGAWTEYIEARKAKWGHHHYQAHLRLAAPGGLAKNRGKGLTTAGPLASLMPLRLSELSSDTIIAWLEKETAVRPTNAAHSYRLLRAFIRWAAETKEYRGTVADEAYNAKSVRELVPSTAAKDDCLQREQLPTWFGAVRGLSSPIVCTYLQALLLTGARPSEVSGLKWEDVDFQWRSLTIRDKVEGTRTIPLTPYLASLLAELKRQNETPPNVRQLKRMEEKGQEWKPSPWVFSSKTAAAGNLSDPSDAHNRALVAAGLPHVTLHGLRRSFGTLCEWVEVPSGISAQIMGHKPSALAEKHYRRRPLDLLRKWHDKIEAWMLEQAGIVFKVQHSNLRAVGAT